MKIATGVPQKSNDRIPRHHRMDRVSRHRLEPRMAKRRAIRHWHGGKLPSHGHGERNVPSPGGKPPWHGGKPPSHGHGEGNVPSPGGKPPWHGDKLPSHGHGEGNVPSHGQVVYGNLPSVVRNNPGAKDSGDVSWYREKIGSCVRDLERLLQIEECDLYKVRFLEVSSYDEARQLSVRDVQQKGHSLFLEEISPNKIKGALLQRCHHRCDIGLLVWIVDSWCHIYEANSLEMTDGVVLVVIFPCEDSVESLKLKLRVASWTIQDANKIGNMIFSLPTFAAPCSTAETRLPAVSDQELSSFLDRLPSSWQEFVQLYKPDPKRSRKRKHPASPAEKEQKEGKDERPERLEKGEKSVQCGFMYMLTHLHESENMEVHDTSASGLKGLAMKIDVSMLALSSLATVQSLAMPMELKDRITGESKRAQACGQVVSRSVVVFTEQHKREFMVSLIGGEDAVQLITVHRNGKVFRSKLYGFALATRKRIRKPSKSDNLSLFDNERFWLC